MNKHEFEAFARTSAGRCATTLLEDHAVKPHQIYFRVRKDALERFQHMGKHDRCKTEMLCDADVWATWTTAERRVAGMCLSYMVRNGILPLYRHITPSGQGAAKYRNAPPTEPVPPPIKIVRARRHHPVQHAAC